MNPEDLPSELINRYCLREVLVHVERHECGCPECCAATGRTAVYTVEDFRPGVRPLGWWAKVICSEKLALLVKERIVPGWPGGKDDGHRMKGPVFLPRGG